MQFPKTIYKINSGKAVVVNSQEDFESLGEGWTASPSLIKIEEVKKKTFRKKQSKK